MTPTSRLPRLPKQPLEVVVVLINQQVMGFVASTSKTSNGTAWKSICKSLKNKDFHDFQTSTPKGVRAAWKSPALPPGATQLLEMEKQA